MSDVPTSSVSVDGGKGGKLGRWRKGKASRPYSPPKIFDTNCCEPQHIAVSPLMTPTSVSIQSTPSTTNAQANVDAVSSQQTVVSAHVDVDSSFNADSPSDGLLANLVDEDKTSRLHKLKSVAQLTEQPPAITEGNVVQVACACGFLFDGDPATSTLSRLEDMLA